MLVIPWEQMDWPLNLGVLFEREAPVVLEIGYGNGDFLVRLAQEDPGRNFLGVEISWASTQRLLARTRRHGLTNLRIVQGNAAFFLDRVLPADSLSQVFINFSDPWPKPRHHSRRVVQTAFLQILFQRMRPDAGLTLATDHPEYADWIADILKGQDQFENTQPTTCIHQVPGRVPTRYESKALNDGIPINYFLWKKPSQALPSPKTPLSQVPDMPNMMFEGSVNLEQLVLRENMVLTEANQGEAVHIKFMGSYHNVSNRSWMVEAIVQEQDFSQHFAFFFAPRSKNRWVLKLSSMGSPRPTWGVKHALGRLGAWILENQPGLTLIGNTTEIEIPTADPVHE